MSHAQVIICSACSGHGFKFCSVIGEVCAELALTGHSSQQTDILKLHRGRPGFDKLHHRFEESRATRSRL